MSSNIIDSKTYTRITFSPDTLCKGEYDNCTFSACDFSNVSLNGFVFLDCTFNACNLSNVQLGNATLNSVRFIDCKLLGVHFENCNSIGFEILCENSNLTHASFFKLPLIKTTFKNNKCVDTDFTECDLSGSLFDNCDLSGAQFNRTNLEKSDFVSSYNYCIDPEKNRLKSARFSENGIKGLLFKYGIIVV
jgi:uncharacterized protein YjbI with pentapeptide repeats